MRANFGRNLVTPGGAQRNPGAALPCGEAHPGLRHGPSKTGVSAFFGSIGLRSVISFARLRTEVNAYGNKP